MSDLLLESLQAASRDDWSKALGFLCRAACAAASAPSAAVFAWPNGAPRCLASYQVDPPNVEELARRAGKVGPAHQLGPYQVFPLLMTGHLDAGFLLESRAPLGPLERAIGAILETIASVVNRKLRDAEQQRDIERWLQLGRFRSLGIDPASERARRSSE